MLCVGDKFLNAFFFFYKMSKRHKHKKSFKTFNKTNRKGLPLSPNFATLKWQKQLFCFKKRFFCSFCLEQKNIILPLQ